MANLIRSTSGSVRLFGQRLQADLLHVDHYVGYMPYGGLALNILSVAEASSLCTLVNTHNDILFADEE